MMLKHKFTVRNESSSFFVDDYPELELYDLKTKKKVQIKRGMVILMHHRIHDDRKIKILNVSESNDGYVYDSKRLDFTTESKYILYGSTYKSDPDKYKASHMRFFKFTDKAVKQGHPKDSLFVSVQMDGKYHFAWKCIQVSDKEFKHPSCNYDICTKDELIKHSENWFNSHAEPTAVFKKDSFYKEIEI